MLSHTPPTMPMMATVAVFTAFILLSNASLSTSSSVTRKSSTGKRLGDFCQALIPTSASSSSSSAETMLPRSYYYCHPAMPNGFVECVFGRQNGDKRDRIVESDQGVLSLDTLENVPVTTPTNGSKADLVESVESISKTVVLDEREFICGPGLFFNSLLKVTWS